MTTYEKVMRLIKKKHPKMREFEREAHIGHATIPKWKTHSPNIKSLRKIADYFNVDVSELIGDDDGKD